MSAAASKGRDSPVEAHVTAHARNDLSGLDPCACQSPLFCNSSSVHDHVVEDPAHGIDRSQERGLGFSVAMVGGQAPIALVRKSAWEGADRTPTVKCAISSGFLLDFFEESCILLAWLGKEGRYAPQDQTLLARKSFLCKHLESATPLVCAGAD